MIAAHRAVSNHLLGAAAALLPVFHYAAAAAPSCDARDLARHEAIRVEELDNWEPIDEQTLLIWVAGSLRAQLVRLDRPIRGLADAPIVVLIDSDRDRIISPCGGDAIAIGDGAGKQARITSIELLSEKRTAELDRDAASMLPVLHHA